METELGRELAVSRLRRDMVTNLAGCPIRELAEEALATLSGWLAAHGFAIIDSDGEIVEL
jgi:hypothetical protein